MEIAGVSADTQKVEYTQLLHRSVYLSLSLPDKHTKQCQSYVNTY